MTHAEKNFEVRKNRKALGYTAAICGLLLILFFLISWKVSPPTQAIALDLIEINLGNNEEGWGQEQPLIKGEMKPTPETPEPAAEKVTLPRPEAEDVVRPDDHAEEDAAPVVKPVKPSPKPTTNVVNNASTTAAAKPKKPKIQYNGPGNGNGNNATEDNGYRMQGGNPNGRGDAGDPTGNKDSYGNVPGGKVGGIRVVSGNRKIVRSYSFTGDLPKATIYANIKVSAAGNGSFVSFAKGSTSRDQRYATAISNYLRNMQFDKSANEDLITVQFNFTVN